MWRNQTQPHGAANQRAGTGRPLFADYMLHMSPSSDPEQALVKERISPSESRGARGAHGDPACWPFDAFISPAIRHSGSFGSKNARGTKRALGSLPPLQEGAGATPRKGNDLTSPKNLHSH